MTDFVFNLEAKGTGTGGENVSDFTNFFAWELFCAQESLEQEPPIDPHILETLELQKQQLEMLITKTRQETSKKKLSIC
jgi:hypothetical protein